MNKELMYDQDNVVVGSHHSGSHTTDLQTHVLARLYLFSLPAQLELARIWTVAGRCESDDACDLNSRCYRGSGPDDNIFMVIRWSCN